MTETLYFLLEIKFCFIIESGNGTKMPMLTSMWLTFSTTDVTIIEEVLLFDFSAILSAVGGSLGLFIGFSFLDLFKFAINKFAENE